MKFFSALTGGSDDGCTPTQGEIDSAVANGPGCDGSSYDPNYVPPFLSGVGCNACGNDQVGVGESCSVCGVGHGIDSTSSQKSALEQTG